MGAPNLSECKLCSKEAYRTMQFPLVDVFKCEHCHHSFSDNYKISPEQIYNDDYVDRRVRVWFKNPDLKLYQYLSEEILKYGDKDQRILDVGCGVGSFLKYLADKDFKKLNGIDYLKNENYKDIDFTQGDYFECNFEHKFDVIVAMYVLPNFEKSHLLMKSFLNRLSDNGKLIICCIDNDSLIYRLSRILYRFGIKFVAEKLYDPHHINHFSNDSLKFLRGQYRFKEILREKRNYPLTSYDARNMVLRLSVRLVNQTAALLNMQVAQLVILEKEEV